MILAELTRRVEALERERKPVMAGDVMVGSIDNYPHEITVAGWTGWYDCDGPAETGD